MRDLRAIASKLQRGSVSRVPPTSENLSSGRLAYEIGGVIGASRAGVFGNFRIRAQRTGAIDSAIAKAGSRNLVGRLALLHPALQSRQRVKVTGPVTAAA